MDLAEWRGSGNTSWPLAARHHERVQKRRDFWITQGSSRVDGGGLPDARNEAIAHALDILAIACQLGHQRSFLEHRSHRENIQTEHSGGQSVPRPEQQRDDYVAEEDHLIVRMQ